MGEILTGTSGYSYKDWIGPFYPSGTAQKDFFKYYSARFPFSELNFSYYKQPVSSTMARLVSSSPDGFLFVVKGHRSLTHQITEEWKKDAGIFSEGIMPMMEAERLAGILLQFPYSFHYSAENRRYLAGLSTELEKLPLLIEFRNSRWQKEAVYREMRDRHLGFVNTDMPKLEGLPAATSIVTSDTGYIRFHGRNSENWWTGDNTSRYDYFYTENQLKSWIPAIRKMAAKTKRLLVAFNNHYKAKAVENAYGITRLLKEE